jgi:hypothetical protein
MPCLGQHLKSVQYPEFCLTEKSHSRRWLAITKVAVSGAEE